MKSCFLSYAPDYQLCVNFKCANYGCIFNVLCDCCVFDDYCSKVPDCFCCENCKNNIKD